MRQNEIQKMDVHFPFFLEGVQSNKQTYFFPGDTYRTKAFVNINLCHFALSLTEMAQGLHDFQNQFLLTDGM